MKQIQEILPVKFFFYKNKKMNRSLKKHSNTER